jgi:PAS domain S-box-containing protein
MKINILDIIDFDKVNTLLEGFNQTTGFVTAILDLEGNVLSKSGWRQMCTEFHRINPETSSRCKISDTVLAGKMNEGESYHFYQCLNGLIDVAVPIVIKGEHVANLFSGQFFFDNPDENFFRKQAQRHNFNETDYINSLKKVPIVSKEKVKVAMDFLLNMTQLISEMSFQKIEQMQLNEVITKSEESYRNVFESAVIGIYRSTPDGQILMANPKLIALLKFDSFEDLTARNLKNEGFEDIHQRNEFQQKIARDGMINMESTWLTKDGSPVIVNENAKVFYDQNGNIIYYEGTI